MIKLLFIGDIIGKAGCDELLRAIPKIRKDYSPDLVIANGENSSENNGISKSSAEFLFSAGADVITTGNHVFRCNNVYDMLEENEFLLRPANYSKNAVGKGICLYDLGRTQILIINLAGRIFMDAANDPFAAADEILKNYPDCKNIIIDFHAEATSEKCALAHYLDGRVSAVIGTHTHVQTSDERILPGGTGFITDAGMTGPYNSILGVEVEDILKKFTTGMPVKFHQASGNCQFCAVLLTLDENTGKTAQIQRINNINN